MEYKYRGKRKDNNEYITGNLIIDEISDKYYIALSVEESEKVGEEGCLKIVSCEVYKETLSAQTGVKDINKKDSYVGDILKDTINEEEYGIVKKDEDSNNVYLEWHYKTYWSEWTTTKQAITLIRSCEIVGNIFENKDMIKKEV